MEGGVANRHASGVKSVAPPMNVEGRTEACTRLRDYGVSGWTTSVVDWGW